ncbi:hypothetical protein Nepgr_023988 [Nepenthes gracilis]|uniref:Secreted protein n=1 Tax=Nepenthes gracilis TaxID=150966 RepID=A0AAD3T2C9_NEPGR|nr:hypothetical protein Nepgr_023988 [Nepenthes gracilis]
MALLFNSCRQFCNCLVIRVGLLCFCGCMARDDSDARRVPVWCVVSYEVVDATFFVGAIFGERWSSLFGLRGGGKAKLQSMSDGLYRFPLSR